MASECTAEGAAAVCTKYSECEWVLKWLLLVRSPVEKRMQKWMMEERCAHDGDDDKDEAPGNEECSEVSGEGGNVK